MKLLAFSDVHHQPRACARLCTRARVADGLLGAGDYACQHHGLNPCIQNLAPAATPALLVHGNNETHADLLAAVDQFWPAAQVVQAASVLWQDLCVFGLGAAIPRTPFGAWSVDSSEDAAAQALESMPEGAVLLTHAPPKGHLDRGSCGRVLGSTAIAEAIIDKRPPLVVCGHIHGSAGQVKRCGNTLVVNAGPQGMMLHLSDHYACHV